MAGPTSAYLGTDMPMMQRMAQPVQDGSQPPAMGGQMDAAMQAEAAQRTIAEAAERYMGVDAETLDDAQYEKLLADLEAGYPDDAGLLDAIRSVREGLAALPPEAAAAATPDASVMAPGPDAGDIAFRPDRPPY